MEIIPQDTLKKQCAGPCQQMLPLTNEFFQRDRSHNDGFRSSCKKCIYARDMARRLPEELRGYIKGDYKQCPSCERTLEKSPDNFNLATKRVDGLAYICNQCRHEKYLKKYQERHPEGGKHRDTKPGYKWCPQCKQELLLERFSYRDKVKGLVNSWCKSCFKEYRDTHIEEEHMWRKEYRNKNRERIRERSKKHRESIKEHISLRSKTYYATNRENILAYNKQYAQTHQGRTARKANHQKRRARLRAIPTDLTTEQVVQKIKLQKYACYYCFKKFLKEKGKYIYHLEHTIPISRTECGPRHDVNHVVLSCPTCNEKKLARLPHEWAEGGRLL